MRNINLNFMVNYYIRKVTKDKKIIKSFCKVPRHLFIPEEYRIHAYEDHSLPIGYGQTISQPSLVAEMIESLCLKGKEKVLEIGTGSGYQTALLAFLADKVFSVELIPELAERAREILLKLKIKNAFISQGDGSLGLRKEAPFDAIIVAASAREIPQPLIEQLKIGGRIVIPILENKEEILKVGIKQKTKLKIKNNVPVRFVPLVGKYEPY